MKNLIYMIMAAVITMMTVASCDKLGWENSTQQDDVNSESSIPFIEDSIKNHLVKQDSLYKGLTQQIDTLTNALNASKAEIAELQQQVKKQEKLGTVWQILIIGTLLLSLVSIIVLVYVKRHFTEIVELSYCDFVKKPVHKDFIKKIVSTSSVTHHTNDEELQSNLNGVYERLNSLEQTVRSMEPEKNKAFPAKVVSSSIRVMYVKDFNQGYFMALTPSIVDGCIFKVELVSETKGEFTHLSLEKLKPINGVNQFVDYTDGNCQLKDAKNAEIKEKGICEKVGEDSWKVMTKLKIKISK